MTNIKVFIADDVNEEKLAPLRDAGFTVEKRIKLSTEELLSLTSGHRSIENGSHYRLDVAFRENIVIPIRIKWCVEF